ncbi:MAG: hypothetical protein BEN19_05005 [Epulopiscium sp. Nuni2H_MBin003]|nr:MAG: hypothetical protein BEN19_05005 [Epulopiscium sp. Nuni2H_MBin003]
MIFITGGKYQGKTEFAKTFGLEVVDNLEEQIKQWLQNDINIDIEVNQLLSKKDIVIVCDEVGCGIVPIEKSERIYREVVGRTACILAKHASAVYKVDCAIARRLK